MENVNKNYKITLFIGSLTGGGAERVTCNLANYLFKKGYNVSLITMSDVKDTYLLDDGIARTHLLRSDERRNKIFDFFIRYRRLSKYVKNSTDDCFVVMLPITTMLLLSLKKNKNFIVIASERNSPDSYNFIEQKMLRFYSKRADGYVFQTNDAKKWYEKITKDSIVIPNAINADFLNSSFNGKRVKKIVAVGRLNEQKNFPMLINAFSKISDEFEDYKLEIYGVGPQKELLKKLITTYKLNGRVLLKGYVANIKDEIKNASLFVLTSNYEGMPNALIEAMALGIPSISTNCPCGGPRDIINHEENGILVEMNNVDQLAYWMKKLLNDKKLSNKISKNASKIVETLNPNKIYQEWENYILKIIANNQPLDKINENTAKSKI